MILPLWFITGILQAVYVEVKHMQIHIAQHPQDPCGRVVVTGTTEEAANLDLLFQAIMSTRHKEGRFTTSTAFEVFFQMDPPIEGGNH